MKFLPRNLRSIVIALCCCMVAIVTTATAAPVYAVDMQGEIITDLAYTDYEGASDSQKLDLYLPQDGDAVDTTSSTASSSNESAHPIVVYIHGGSWRHDTKDLTGKEAMFNAFLNAGYAVASIEYRLSVESPWPAQILDCKAAMRYIRANADEWNIDPDRIAVLGTSAGAHLAMMLGVTNGDASFEDKSMGYGEYSSDVQAVISMYGIADVSQWGRLAGDNVDEANIAKQMLLGDGHSVDMEKAASPITYVDGNEPPMMLVHAADDGMVSVQQSYMMESALIAAGEASSMATWHPATGGHGEASVFYDDSSAQRRYLDFLAFAFGSPDSDDAADDAEDALMVDVYRIRNMNTGEHLYSSDRRECDLLVASGEWKNEGVAFRAVSVDEDAEEETGTSVYRLYDPKGRRHLLSSDAVEYSAMVDSGWTGEGKVFAGVASGGAPVRRLYNRFSGEHLYTANAAEYDTLSEQGWIPEGIVFRAGAA